MSETIAQTYVWHEGKAFFVSTINRESSAAAAYGATYAETMAWDWSPETRERGAMIGQDEDGSNSIRTHQIIVNRLRETGLFDEPEEE